MIRMDNLIVRLVVNFYRCHSVFTKNSEAVGFGGIGGCKLLGFVPFVYGIVPSGSFSCAKYLCCLDFVLSLQAKL